MSRATWIGTAAVVVLLSGSHYVAAATVPFVEHFSADVANWKDAASAPLTYQPAGGPDGSSYATTTYSFALNAAGDNQTIFRGQDSFDSSGDAFVGNWIVEGVDSLTAKVRHNAPVPVGYFARLASSMNFPGGIAIQFAPVLPNVWTELSFEISSGSPQLFYFEGGDFDSIYSNIGNIQLGVTVPAALAGSSPAYAFDLDQVTIVPEPGAVGLGIICWFGVARIRSRRLTR